MKSSTTIIFLIIIAAGAFFLFSNKNDTTQTANSNIKNFDSIYDNNVSIVDGKQIITINAKAGYQPRKSVAKAGKPTVIRFDTNGTFDCSSTVRIPSINISKVLPQTGSTDIDIGTQQVATIQGTCGMGMYPFEVDFKS